MRNHDQKLKDMAESVLPSTRRRAARLHRRRLHHAERARARQALHDWVGSVDRDDLDVGVRSTYRRDIQDLVSDRQAADKVGPLVRWALRTVDTSPSLAVCPHADQVAVFRALLPDNLIGRHAVSHIDSALYWHCWRVAWAQPSLGGADRELSEVRTQVLSILDGGRHKELNRRIKETAARQALDFCGRPVPRAVLVPNRLLLGAHDLDDFAASACRHGAVRRIIGDVAAL